MMAEYIFLTTEGSTYQPNSDSLEPDIDNVQVIGFARGMTVQEAAIGLIQSNAFLADTSFDEVFAIKLADANREYMSLRQLFQKAS